MTSVCPKAPGVRTIDDSWTGNDVPPGPSAAVSSALFLTPCVWPILFLVLGFALFPGVPSHYNWDNYSYLDVAKKGQCYLGLGLGRSLFCTLGVCLEGVASRFGSDPLWGAFRLWVGFGIVFQAAALFVLAPILARRIGLLAAHVALALYATHSGDLILLWGVWPENYSTAFLFLSAAILASGSPDEEGGRFRPSWRLLAGGIAAVAMVLMKEVAVYYLPALVAVTLCKLPARTRFARRIGISGLWGVSVVMVAIAGYAALYLLQRGIPESMGSSLTNHFSQQSVGPSMALQNLRLLTGAQRSLPVMCLLILVALGRFLIALCRRRESRVFLAIFAVGVLTVAGPAILISLVGSTTIAGRFWVAFAPGTCLLGASAFVWRRREAGSPAPASTRLADGGQAASLSQWKICAIATLFAFIVSGTDWRGVRHYVRSTRHDAERYQAMLNLRDTPLAICATPDAWPAHYISLYSSPDGKKPRWTILWPEWDENGVRSPTREWIQWNLSEGLRIAVTPDMAQAAGKPFPDWLKSLCDDEFVEDPSGWWISALR